MIMINMIFHFSLGPVCKSRFMSSINLPRTDA